MTNRSMLDAIALALNRRLSKLHVPLWPVLVAAIGFELTFRPLGIQPPLHRRRLDFFRKSFIFSTRKAEQLIDFRPAISFGEGAAQTAAWYRANGYLKAPP